MNRILTLLLAGALVLGAIAMTAPQNVGLASDSAAPPVSAPLPLPDTGVLDAGVASASPALWVVLAVLGAIWLVMLMGGSLWKSLPFRGRSPDIRGLGGPGLRIRSRLQRALGRSVLRPTRQARKGSDASG